MTTIAPADEMYPDTRPSWAPEGSLFVFSRGGRLIPTDRARRMTRLGVRRYPVFPEWQGPYGVRSQGPGQCLESNDHDPLLLDGQRVRRSQRPARVASPAGRI